MSAKKEFFKILRSTFYDNYWTGILCEEQIDEAIIRRHEDSKKLVLLLLLSQNSSIATYDL